ncbi:hypothetical protein [Citrobacter braakii]
MKIWLVLVMIFLCLLQIAIDCSAAWQSVNRSLVGDTGNQPDFGSRR